MTRHFRGIRPSSCSAALALFFASTPTVLAESDSLLAPRVTSINLDPAGNMEVIAQIPPGYRHAVLEVIPENGVPSVWQPMVSGSMTGAQGSLRFIVPNQGSRAMARVRLGPELEVPPATLSGLDFMSPSYSDGGFYLSETSKPAHILNRIGYGPTPTDYNMVQTLGAEAYIERQLAPESIDESSNEVLNERIGSLFHEFLPYGGKSALVSPGVGCRFFKGTSEPAADWNTGDFDDQSWEAGVTGLGYGDDDDETLLGDMQEIEGVQPGYLSVYVRIDFEVEDTASIENLILRMKYDDGFVAYINGVEVARENVAGTPPTFDTTATTTGGNVDESNEPGEWNLTSSLSLLETGTNTLAIQLHNAGLTSSDSSLIPSLLDVNATPYAAIKGIDELQYLLHLRGIYSERQLQAVLAEFWENHFTTDYDKVRDYFEDLDAFENLSESDEDAYEAQTRTEAVSLEYAEYEFFRDNALGNFGDLLLFSATSPTMLVYLDSVLNRRNAPNENYAREILELHTHGVNNGYTQFDIEELARCFTGWTIRKVRPEHVKAFPQSARTPPITASLAVDTETAVIDEGAMWDFLRGSSEPSPGPDGEPTIDWTQPGYSSRVSWETGPSGIGYGDNDDATVLEDMRNNYVSVYARTEFLIDDDSYDSLVLEVDYDDGYVAYLNGVEISRSSSMRNNGTPPAYDETSGGHEIGNPAIIDLAPFASLLNPSPTLNVLAIQAHNTSLGSSDLSLNPRLLKRSYTPDSIAESDPGGIWTFRFDPDEHDTGAKTLFDGAPYQIDIPADRLGADGVNDALEVIDALTSHRATAEFVCLKLINRFVSDEISLDTYQNRSAPEWLLTMMDDTIAAWQSTSPQGNIATVMRSILDPSEQSNGFWIEGSDSSKVKTPIEFINSGFRALEADVTSDDLVDRNDAMGMDFFRRDEPDGYSEIGADWVETLGLLERMKFSQSLGSDRSFSRSRWDIESTLEANGIITPEDLISHFDTLLFSGKLGEDRWRVYLDFSNTDDQGSPSPFEGLSQNRKLVRLRELAGLILASPEFQFQ